MGTRIVLRGFSGLRRGGQGRERGEHARGRLDPQDGQRRAREHPTTGDDERDLGR
jgi:hypothetical protein